MQKTVFLWCFKLDYVRFIIYRTGPRQEHLSKAAVEISGGLSLHRPSQIPKTFQSLSVGGREIHVDLMYSFCSSNSVKQTAGIDEIVDFSSTFQVGSDGQYPNSYWNLIVNLDVWPLVDLKLSSQLEWLQFFGQKNGHSMNRKKAQAFQPLPTEQGMPRHWTFRPFAQALRQGRQVLAPIGEMFHGLDFENQTLDMKKQNINAVYDKPHLPVLSVFVSVFMCWLTQKALGRIKCSQAAVVKKFFEVTAIFSLEMLCSMLRMRVREWVNVSTPGSCATWTYRVSYWGWHRATISCAFCRCMIQNTRAHYRPISWWLNRWISMPTQTWRVKNCFAYWDTVLDSIAKH